MARRGDVAEQVGSAAGEVERLGEREIEAQVRRDLAPDRPREDEQPVARDEHP